jgi:hypothetical protein
MCVGHHDHPLGQGAAARRLEFLSNSRGCRNAWPRDAPNLANVASFRIWRKYSSFSLLQSAIFKSWFRMIRRTAASHAF